LLTATAAAIVVSAVAAVIVPVVAAVAIVTFVAPVPRQDDTTGKLRADDK
jgi:hypothetical protein